jgi:peptide/nickel transport system substrate-binding protein
MTGRSRYCALVALVLLCAVGCAPTRPTPASGENRAAPPVAPSGPKRITIVFPNEPPAFYYPLAPLSTRSGGAILYDIIHPGLSVTDHENVLRPILAEAVPSTENGLWKLLPDGRMQTTWQLRPGVAWHDGTPLTSEDLAFTMQVVRDRELAPLRNQNYDLIESVSTPDARTVTLNWTRPYIDADQGFTFRGTSAFGLPMPKHLLETAYANNKAGFLDLPYWGEEFVGLGPFRLQQWVRGSHVVVVAFDGFVLGRPKIDEIEARFIPDQNTIISNVLAGSVDVFRGATVGVDQGLQVREQWKGGILNMPLNNWVVIYPQFVNPQPEVVLNVQFRKALLYAIDRQAMADTLMAGLVPLANGPLDPNSREFKATEASAVKYEFDPRRAVQLIEGIGYTRGADGMFRDAAGPLGVDIRGAASRDIHVKGLFPIANNWQAVGVGAETVVISAQQASDLQDQATFRAFQLVRQDYHLNRLISYHSSQARLPERNFTGSNNGRYMNPEMDALIERYLATVPWTERMQAAGQILHHITDQLPAMGLFYDLEVTFISNRLQNATPLLLPATSQMWNAYEWDVR